MLTCKCGGVLLVIRIEEPPNHLTKQEKLVYNRVCDVQCTKCEMTYYSQPYDFGTTINPVKRFEHK